MDRFLFKLSMGDVTPEEELQILDRFQTEDPFTRLGSVTEPEEIVRMSGAVRNIHIAEALKKYLVDIIHAARASQLFSVGASTRASIALMRSSQAFAAVQGREYVIPDDIKYVAPFALCHRLKLSEKERLTGNRVEDALAELLSTIPVPAVSP